VEQPPYVDEHEVVVRAPRDRVWLALTSYVGGVLATGRSSVVTRLLGAVPASGFGESSRLEGESLELTGRHRFSRYRLVFSIHDAGDATALRATTYAAFPGVRGRAYRALVIGTRLHVLATRRMLDAVRRRSEDRGPGAS
jgi:hypothetical protein